MMLLSPIRAKTTEPHKTNKYNSIHFHPHEILLGLLDGTQMEGTITLPHSKG